MNIICLIFSFSKELKFVRRGIMQILFSMYPDCSAWKLVQRRAINIYAGINELLMLT
jgi:hypothetical protein